MFVYLLFKNEFQRKMKENKLLGINSLFQNILELYSIALYVIIVLNIFLDSQNRISQGYFRGTWTLM